MPLLVLSYKDNGKKIVSIWCDEVPPPLGGGPGRLVIPNVERMWHTKDPQAPNDTDYEYLAIPRVGDDNSPEGQPPEDLCITLGDVPNATNGWVLPYNGGQLSEGLVTVRLKTCPND